MKKLAIAAIAAAALQASAGVAPFPVSAGLNRLDAPGRVLRCDASSTNLSGAVELSAVRALRFPVQRTAAETNVSWIVAYTNMPHQLVRLDGRTVYDSPGTAASLSYATNVVGSATNVVATFLVGTNAVAVVTNAVTELRTSYVPTPETRPVTNVAVRAFVEWGETRVTNSICTFPLSAGYGANTNDLSSVVLPGGVWILGSGTAFEGGGATIYFER